VFDVPARKNPTGVAVSADGRVYVAQWGSHTINVFAADDGRRLRTLGKGRGHGKRQLDRPIGVALSADGGTLFVADCENDRVAVWRAADGAPLRSIGAVWPDGEGSEPGQLSAPYGLALSPDGTELFVVELCNHRVSVFEPRTGRHLRSWGRPGSGAGEFYRPTCCVLSCDGRVLFVADSNNGRVVACDAASGGAVWCYDDLIDPDGLALSRCGRELFVADSDSDRVVVLSVDDGSVVRSWYVEGAPSGVGLGPDGRLFVTSVNTSRLQKFS
jgi:tripartite motif-containing protein 71